MKYTWLVEKYLEGELSGEALRKFELEILRNPEAAKELERIRSLQRFMENQHALMSEKGGLTEDYDDLENVLQEYEVADELEGLKIRKISTQAKGLRDYRTRLTEAKANRTLQSRRSNKILVRKVTVWMAAASIALLIVTSSLFFIGGNRSIDYQSVYDQFYIAAKIDNSDRASSAGAESLFNTALSRYAEENFEEAFKMFERTTEPVVNLRQYLYHGISAMEVGKYSEAIIIFRHLENELVLNQHRMWYTGLCYLAMKDGENARSFFKAIVEQKGHYMRQSETILRKI